MKKFYGRFNGGKGECVPLFEGLCIEVPEGFVAASWSDGRSLSFDMSHEEMMSHEWHDALPYGDTPETVYRFFFDNVDDLLFKLSDNKLYTTTTQQYWQDSYKIIQGRLSGESFQKMLSLPNIISSRKLSFEQQKKTGYSFELDMSDGRQMMIGEYHENKAEWVVKCNAI